MKYVPLIGIIFFAILYIIAAWLYPGGSNFDKNSVGFNLLQNYWCDLLGDTAKNGMPNPASSVAMAAMLLLFTALGIFWWQIPRIFILRSWLSNTIRYCGSLSMFFAFFIFTAYHDTTMNIAGCLGCVALIGVFIGLYRAKQWLLVAYGYSIVLLVGLNNYIYYTTQLLVYLPVVQKISFFYFLLWVALLQLKVIRSEYYITST